MFCHACGISLQENDLYCGACGTPKLNTTGQRDEPTQQSKKQGVDRTADVADFFKNSFTGIVSAVLFRPVQGTYDIFKNAKDESYKHALILMGMTGLAYFVLPFLFLSGVLDDMGLDFGDFLKLGILGVIFLLCISVQSFFLKSMSGKPDFKKELLTGGICGIPMLLLMVFFVIAVLSTDEVLLYFETNVEGLIVWIIIECYIVLMLFNIVQQSMKAAGSNDALSWYVSPIVIIVSVYVMYLFGKVFFS